MPSSTLTIDFETRSAIDLRKTGVYRYAEDASTDVWCAAWAIDDEPVELWTPDQPCPPRLAAHVSAGGILAAWNANFEITIWTHILTPRYGWPLPKLDQWRCSMAAAYAMSLPGSLENAAGAIGLDIGKDMSGRRTMMAMSQPRRPRKGELGDKLLWHDDEERKQRLFAYCKNDVEVERGIRERLVSLRAQEQKLWHLDQEINRRGVYVDETLCLRAKAIVAKVTEKLDREMAVVTDWNVTACSNIGELKVWLKKRGIDTEALDKEAVVELLIRHDLDDATRRALELRQEAGRTSVAKIEALLKGMSADKRARGLLQFLAALSGRWGGRRFQPQNLKRPELEDAADVDAAIEIILNHPPEKAARLLEAMYGPVLSVIGDCIRGMVRAAPGKKLMVADFSQIELIVAAWLARQQDKVAAFKAYTEGNGPDLYKLMASKIRGKSVAEVTKAERQAYGKVPELACQYQGCVGAFQMMAHTYGVKVTDDEAAAIVKAWRAANLDIKQCWRDLEDAAMRAVRSPGETQVVDRIAFRVSGSFLWMQLPSKRAICLPYPRIVWKEMPWTDDDGKPVKRQVVSFKGVDSFTKKWTDQFLYGGQIFNYAVQGTARDIMAEAMPRVEAAGYPVILTIHDEVVTEVDEGFGSVSEFENLMTTLPAWADGLPIAAEAWSGTRYRK